MAFLNCGCVAESQGLGVSDEAPDRTRLIIGVHTGASQEIVKRGDNYWVCGGATFAVGFECSSRL